MYIYIDKVSPLVSPKMSAPAPDLPPVAFQVAVISTGFNSTLFFSFLMGLSLSTSHLNQYNLTVFRHLYNRLLWYHLPLW